MGNLIKLNLGGFKGKEHFPAGWSMVDSADAADVNVDLAEQPLPFEDNSVDAVYTSHTLEHILPDALPFCLSEVRRVLKPKCKLRICVPDIDIAIRSYVKGDMKFLRDRLSPTKMDFLPDFPICYLHSWFYSYKIKHGQRRHNGHKMAFTRPLLKWYVERAGFRDISFKSFNDCDPVFVKCDFPRYKDYSIYMEASK
jgi:predicted SAM-dependent methyltransferase